MIVLMRHARTDGGKGRYIGTTDLALSEYGREQAVVLSDSLEGLPFKSLWTSPLGRARDTAAPIAAGLGLSLETMPGLAEVSLGRWEGRTFEEVERDDPKGYAARGLDFANFRPPGGESFADVAQRALEACARMAAGPAPCLAVTHAGVIRVLLCRILGLPLNELFSFTPLNICSTVLKSGKNGLFVQAFNCPPGGLAELLETV